MSHLTSAARAGPPPDATAPDAQQLQHLAAAFTRRGMKDHVRALRARAWTAGHVVEWMRFLKVPPPDNDYSLLPRGSPCPRCRSLSPDRTATGTMVAVNFPGGWAERCLGCRATWLHAERF